MESRAWLGMLIEEERSLFSLDLASPFQPPVNFDPFLLDSRSLTTIPKAFAAKLKIRAWL